MSTLDRPRPHAATTASPLSLTPLSDAALAKLVANGGDGAFEVLYERYRADLSRYCRALLRNPEDAEEAFQGTMLNALRALRSGDGGRTMRPWLYRIAHNQCASMIRARRPSSALSPDQPSLLDPPEDQAALAEQIRHLRADLGSLPALQRSALVMREMSGLSHRAIAAALAVEPADARQLVYEARRSLDECRIGRESGCDEVRGQIADGDRRRLRSRRVRAHLRGCEHCSAYVASQTERRRGYAALAPAMPAAAGKQVFDRLMGGSPSTATAGTGAIGIPGGVAGTLAGLAAGFNPGTSAKAWARLPEGAATGMAGAGATAGVALLSLALTALLLNGGNAAYGSWSEPSVPAPTTTVLEVAVVGPPGAADIGYRATVSTDPPVVAAPAPTGPEPQIEIRGAAISERSSTAPPPPPPTAGTSITLVELPASLPPDRPAADTSRPRLVDVPVSTSIGAPAPTVPAPADEAVAAPVDGATPPAPGQPEPAEADPASPAADPAPDPTEVGSGPDPEPIVASAENPTADAPTPSEESREDDESSPGPAQSDAVGSGPDPEPAAASDESGSTKVTEADPSPEEPSPEVGSGPDPEPEADTEPVEAEPDSPTEGSGEEPTDPTVESSEQESPDGESSEVQQLSESAASTEVCP